MFDWPLYPYAQTERRGALVGNAGNWDPGSIIERTRKDGDSAFVEKRYVHTEEERAVLARYYDDFCDPPWHRIQGDLIRLGADPATFSQLTAPAIVALLERMAPVLVDPVANEENVRKLFPQGVPDDSEVVDVVVRLDAARGTGKSKSEIAREYTGETSPNDEKAKKILARIRMLRNRGKLNLD
ncbi:MAG: hypothetical protein H6822_19730 [Planctomycetaceae bacterium]|nr:hypothetical protein [Planctomycetales bacterium]MCB9924419.1 hypothetical protein [Planctomycetaceae bacterium]